jgi:protein-S-isoprenylcysteine O-methyltransferase Ste14
MLGRIFVFLYSLVCYAAGFAALVYAIGFVGNYVVPKTIDSGATGDLQTALIVNLVLLGLFAVQHSGMARRGFKSVWTRIVSPPAERATYVLFTAALLALIYWQWRPLPAEVWHVGDANAATLLTVIYFAGWAMVLISSFLINHFELFGLQQAFAHLRGRQVEPPQFRTPFFYRFVRHPIYTGLLMAFWATPVMSQGHLLFAVATTGYIFIGLALEERDLVHYFGAAYRDYRRRVPAVIPLTKFSGRREKSPASGQRV